MKDWEVVANNLKKTGFNVSALDVEGTNDLDCGHAWLRKAFRCV